MYYLNPKYKKHAKKLQRNLNNNIKRGWHVLVGGVVPMKITSVKVVGFCEWLDDYSASVFFVRDGEPAGISDWKFKDDVVTQTITLNKTIFDNNKNFTFRFRNDSFDK